MSAIELALQMAATPWHAGARLATHRSLPGHRVFFMGLLYVFAASRLGSGGNKKLAGGLAFSRRHGLVVFAIGDPSRIWLCSMGDGRPRFDCGCEKG